MTEHTQKPTINQEVHVYSSNACMQLKAHVSKSGFKTVLLEFAIKKNEGFDWQNKIAMELTKRELPVVIAIALNLMQVAAFKDRGAKDNNLLITHQGVNLFIKAQKGDRKVQIPVESFDAMYAANLALSQLAANYPTLTSDSVLVMVKQIVGQMGQEKQRQWKEKNKVKEG